MLSKPAKIFTVLFCSLVCMLAAVWLFRLELLRAGANGVLASRDISVLDLQGVQVGGNGVTAGRVELQFDTSGLRVTLDKIDVRWHRPGFFSMPIVDSLSIDSVRLQQEAAVETAEPAASALLLGDLLQLLREFPLADITMAEITVPGWPDALALALQHRAGALSVQIASADQQLQLAFTQADASAAAHLQVALNTGADVVGNVLLDITPVAAGWQLQGNAHLDLTALMRLPALARAGAFVLPVESGMLDLEVAAVIADDLGGPPDVLDVGINEGSVAAVPAGLIAGLGAVEIALAGRAQATIALREEGIVITSAVLPLTAAGEYQAQPFTLAATLRPADCRLSANVICTAGFDADATLAAFMLPGDAADPGAAAAIAIRDLAVSGSGLLELGNGTLQLALDAGAQLSSGSVASPSFNVGGLAFASSAPIVMQRQQPDDAMTITGAHVSGMLGQLDMSGYQFTSDLDIRDIDVTLAAVPLGQFSLQTRGLTVSGPQPWLPAIDIDARIALDQNNLTFTAPLLLRGAPSDLGLQVEGRYALASGSAALSMHLPRLSLDGEGKSLSSFVGGWPWPFDLMTGAIEAGIELQLQPAAEAGNGQDDAADGGRSRITGSIDATLTNAAGYYNEMFFRGVNTALVATADTAGTLPVNTPPLAITIAEINVGLPVSNIAVDYQVDGAGGSLTVHSFYGETLGGTLTGEDVVYDMSRERNTMNLQFDGLRLDRLLELVEYDGIDASGAVSGELPLSTTPDGVEVTEGRLQADAPGGSIRYQNAAGASGNPGIDLVNQALSNYQFESLASSIDYKADGELLLAMQLQGHNPDMNDGQRINLNLNLSDNIPVLLQSLQAGRAIEEFVQDQYQRDPE